MRVSPNLSKTLSLTLEMVTALENRDFELAYILDQKRQIYCQKDIEFDHYDWIKFDLVCKIQEYLIEEMHGLKTDIESNYQRVAKNYRSISKSYLKYR